MMPEPLNGRKDDRPIPATITGHRFSRLTDRCELTHSLPGGTVCNKLFSDISAAPESAIDDHTQRFVWAGEAHLTRTEWNEIQAEKERIMACCRS